MKVFVSLAILGSSSFAASAADETSLNLKVPAIAFPAYEPGCGDGHHLVSTPMTDGSGAFVEGWVGQARNGNAVVSLSFSEMPPDKTVRVLGFVSIDHGAPITVFMTVGKVENIILPKLKRGKHEATTGTFYLYSDGRIEQKGAFSNCFTSEDLP